MKTRRGFVGPRESLSMRRQCEMLGVNRSSLYYENVGPDAEELELMRRIDELHLEFPFYGSRRMARELRAQGLVVNRKRVQRLMRQMGITALYPKKGTSRPGKGHKIYPYLLKGLDIDRPNKVWAADLTYIPMARGFVYLVVVMDWYSRKVLSWRLSNTMESDFCVDALEEAMSRYGKPEIFNTDQGAQFTSEAFTDVLKAAEIKISMDGKGRWVDNVFVERLWRSLKYEEVYLRAYESVSDARARIGAYFRFYNSERKHQSLKAKPDQAYFGEIVLPEAA